MATPTNRQIKRSPNPSDNEPSQEFQNFDKAMRRALSVPKAEIDKREAEWRNKQTAKRHRKEPTA